MMVEKSRTGSALSAAEQKRVDGLLARERADQRTERKRRDAEDEIRNGRFANIEDTVVFPTPEQLRHGEFAPIAAEKVDGTARTVTALRRVTPNRLLNLHQRGVLSDDTFPACMWYRRQWEAAGLTITCSAAKWGEHVRGEPAYGFMPKTAREAEARKLFRHARGFIPGDMVTVFDAVVLEELSITDAARAARCRYVNVTAVIRHAALLLLGGVAQHLPVRAQGAPGSVPGDTKDLDRLRRVEALRDRTTVEGEKAAAADAAERIRERLDPIFFNKHKILRPWGQIAAITRGRVNGLSDGEILAGLDREEAA